MYIDVYFFMLSIMTIGVFPATLIPIFSMYLLCKHILSPLPPPPTVGESCACNKPEIIILLNQNKRAPNITFLPLEAIYQNKHASNVTFLVLSISHKPEEARFM